MDNRSEMLQLCRLCLVKDDVNIPIFEEQGDIRQIFLKISSCLPVKVSREDKLPQKICDGCSYKLDMLYEFWNTTANAEKQLLSWLGEAGMNSKMADGTMSAVAQQIKPVETFVKQEAIDPSDIHTEENDDDKSYMFQDKFTADEAGPSATVTPNAEEEEEEEPPPKRARRTAAVKAQIAMDPESDDDDDDSGEPMTKIEDESEDSEGDDHESSFVDVPSTSADDQPGPSGVGKDGVEAPLRIYGINLNIYCDKCNKYFETTSKLKQHLKYHGEKKFECETCGEKFLYNYLAENHKKRVHLNEIIIKCNMCDKTFSNNYHLQQHEKIIHLGVRYPCYNCNKVFTTVRYLNEHMKSHDPNYRKPQINCLECPKIFESVRSYKTHLGTHSGENKNICDMCGKVVSSIFSLRIHMRKHTGEKPHQCEFCEKRFVNKQALNTHRRIHTKEKPYLCKICQKSFTQKVTLNVHMRCHTGERPYACHICTKHFVTKTVLKNHRCKGIPNI